MNDAIKRVLVLADEFALSSYHHDTPDSREAARQALHDELTRLFTPLSDEQIIDVLAGQPNRRDITLIRALEALNDCRDGCEEPHKTAAAIKALEDALK